jgi:quercetin dioxygenase-like cupin family protein
MMHAPHLSAIGREGLVPYGPGISWSVLAGDGMTLVYWVFEPPACGSVPMHDHDIAQGGVVLEGAITLMYDDGTEETLRSGDFYVLRGRTPHGARLTERCVVVDIFTPNRVEYEQRYAERRTTEHFSVR